MRLFSFITLPSTSFLLQPSSDPMRFEELRWWEIKKSEQRPISNDWCTALTERYGWALIRPFKWCVVDILYAKPVNRSVHFSSPALNSCFLNEQRGIRYWPTGLLPLPRFTLGKINMFNHLVLVPEPHSALSIIAIIFLKQNQLIETLRWAHAYTNETSQQGGRHPRGLIRVLPRGKSCNNLINKIGKISLVRWPKRIWKGPD